MSEPTHQPERVVAGHCPKCEAVVVVFNNREPWPPVICACGWGGSTTAIKNRQRLDRGGYIEGDPRTDERSGRVEFPEPMRGPLTELIADHLDQQEHGIMRCEFTTVGGHIHCHIFGPYSGKAGELIFRAEEWDHFQRTHPSWQFRERAAT